MAETGEHAEAMAPANEHAAELRADVLQQHNQHQVQLVMEAAVQKQASSSDDEDSSDNASESSLGIHRPAQKRRD